MLKIESFRVNHASGNLFSDNPNPYFEFALSSDQKDSSVVSAVLTMNGWSKEVSEIQGILYEGNPLKPFTDYPVHLSVSDNLGNKAEADLIYSTGYAASSFKGKWITDGNYVFKEAKISPKPMLFHKKLELKGKVKSVCVYSTVMGIYDFYLNEEKVGKRYFAPGFTSYHHQLQYQRYDITSLLKEENDLYFEVAGGWAVGSYVFTRKNRVSADKQALLCDIRIEYEDGSKEIIPSDESWDVTMNSPVLMADIYDGETFDANVSMKNASYHKAKAEEIREHPILLADYSAPVVAHEVMKPVKVTTSPSGKTIYDFGQNFAGVISLDIQGAEGGETIIVKHAEILKKDGELNTAFLRSAKATATYTCKKGDQHYSPTLSYMGFRYASLEGIDPSKVEVRAYALYSDVEEIGSFECSNPLINRLNSNIKWSSKSNFMDVPTDCPQRDERMGWTGDIAVFAKTAYFNFDMSRFIDKWLRDLRSQQLKTGGIPNTIPVQGYGFPATMPKMAIDFWGDAALLVPFADYEATGDVHIIEKSYESMKKYVNACKFWANLIGFGKNRYIWKTPSTFHFGDWVAPDVPKMSQWQGRSAWTATASLCNTSHLVSVAAGILGKEEDQKYYADLSAKVADAYDWKFMDENGKLKNEFQTGYVLPIYYHMLGEKQLKAAENLATLVKKNNYCIGTGFPGTPYILFALADNGQKDTAFAMLENTKCPSWLHEVKAGGTTIWERWDGLDENGQCTIGEDGTGGMISYNHYASGAVGDFLYRRVAGIEMVTPGYKTFKIQPVVGGSLTYAKASTRSPYGKISSSWKKENDKFTLDVEVPYGTTCEVILPSGKSESCTYGSHHFEE